MSAGSVLDLMLPAFCLCVLMVGMLSYLGLHVIRREIIFVDLALAQIAALGSLIGFLLGIPLHTGASYVFAVTLTAMAAIAFTLSRPRNGRVPQEAVIGLAYAIAAAAALLLIDQAPHGAEHIKDILTGSILWVGWKTVAIVAAVYAVVGVFHFVFRKPFLIISDDVEAARGRGYNIRWWDFLFYLSFGLVITVSVDSAGVLLVFVFLVAPSVMAVMITDRLSAQLAIGWGAGIVATTAGLAGSYVADLSSGPLVIVTYAVVLLLVSVVIYNRRAHDHLRAARRTAVVSAVFLFAVGVLFLGGRAAGRRYGEPELPSTSHAGGEAHRSPVSSEISALDRRLVQEEDPRIRADLVGRALDLDPVAGAALALHFLEGDPPSYFGEGVVDRLDDLIPGSSGYDAREPFAAPANQQAVSRLRRELGLRID